MTSNSCSVAGCERPYRCSGFCQPHYARWRTRGDPFAHIEIRDVQASDMDRLLDKCMPVTETGCWIWTAGLDGKGYGQIQFEGRVHRAHRISYILHKGAIPNGLFLCHHCDQPLCVNPEHLFPGTHQDNMRDRDRKGRCNPKRGEANYNARLSLEQALEIRQSTGTQLMVAKEYGISAGHVWRIRQGISWPELNRSVEDLE